MLQNLLNDAQVLFNEMNKLYGLSLYRNFFLWKKNIVAAETAENPSSIKMRETFLLSQKCLDKKAKEDLFFLDSLNIPIIGLKGPFIKDVYYGSIDRFYTDIDLLVSSADARKLYEAFLHLGYRIRSSSRWDSPAIKMRLCPEKYMNRTQALMMCDKNNNIRVDIHSNLNITNAHLTRYNTNFDTSRFFENSMPYKTYKNINTLDLHDELCYVCRHLMKHHVFYGRWQMGLGTPIQLVLDVAVIINSSFFNEDIFFDKAIEYSLIPEVLYCLNLYNKIFKSGKHIDTAKYKKMVDELNYKVKWKPLLLASLEMSIEDVMIGNFGKYFPALQYVIVRCKKIRLFRVSWFIQGVFVHAFIERLLKT